MSIVKGSLPCRCRRASLSAIFALAVMFKRNVLRHIKGQSRPHFHLVCRIITKDTLAYNRYLRSGRNVAISCKLRSKLLLNSIVNNHSYKVGFKLFSD